MATRIKHYTVDDAKKVIYADILALSEKEEAEVEKFVKFGFSVENKVVKKTIVKRLDEDYILNYLKDDQNALDTYKSKKESPVRGEDGKEKLTSTGKVWEQGFNAARNWFAMTYPKDVNVAINAIKNAKLEDKLEDGYKKYIKKAKEATENATENDEKKKVMSKVMSKDEYTKDFYWKKVFIKPNPKKEEAE